MLTVKITYVIELTPQEFRLVSAALQGTLQDEWIDEARELQDRLFKARNKEATNKLGNIAKLSKEK